MSKFIKVYEKAIERFEKNGAVVGDYVLFKKGAKSSEWYKNLSGQRKDYVDEIMKLSSNGKLLMLTDITDRDQYKNVTPAIGTVKVEVSPGLNMYPIEIPMELLDYHMDLHTARTTYKQPTLGDEKPPSPKAEIDPKYKTPDIGQSNHIKGGNYETPKTNTTLKYM